MPGIKISELDSADLLEDTDYLVLARPGMAGGTTYKILGSIFGRRADITDLANSKVNKSGDTMGGKLTLDGAPIDDLHAATKKYVDDKTSDISGKVNRIGDTMGGKLTLDGAPIDDLHAATKKYVDEQIAAAKISAQNALNGLRTWDDLKCSPNGSPSAPVPPY
jgi:hypothetical protein